MDKLGELRLDIEETESLLKVSQRPSVRQVLDGHRRRMEAQIDEIKKLSKVAVQAPPTAEVLNPIDRFAWDQSAEYVKIYASVDCVESLPAEAVSTKFEGQSAELTVRDLHNKSYSLKLLRLYAPIDTGKSTWSVKRNTVTLRLAKLRRGENWPSVAQPHEPISPTPRPDLGADPSDSIMNMMKSLYNEGDSEMKRTIAKAWTESQERRMKGLGENEGIF